VSMLDELLPLNMIGIKKVQGGSLEDSVLVRFSFVILFNFFPYTAKEKIYDISM
jgi:T-complex protein 1 subunit eta